MGITIFVINLRNNKLTKTIKELIEKIETAYTAFKTDGEAQTENGNKAAGIRARKASLEIEKLMKEFRKTSIEASKQ